MITLSAGWKMLLAGTLAGAILSGSQVAAGEGSIEEERNRELVASGLQAWADGTGSPYDLLADDVQWTITGNSLAAKTYPNKEAFLDDVIRPFNARMRERLVPTLHRLYAEGDTIIAHFDARGIARDGIPYVNSYAWILQLSGGKIVRAHAFFDSIVPGEARCTPVTLTSDGDVWFRQTIEGDRLLPANSGRLRELWVNPDISRSLPSLSS